MRKSSILSVFFLIQATCGFADLEEDLYHFKTKNDSYAKFSFYAYLKDLKDIDGTILFQPEPILKTDPLSLDNLAFKTRESLSDENKTLQLFDFYEKYKADFENYNIFLNLSDNYLKSPSGNIYVKYNWESDLERNLTSTTDNHFKAQVLSRAYYHYIFPLFKKTQLSPEATSREEFLNLDKSFQWFLNHHSVYFGPTSSQVKANLLHYSVFKSFFKNEANLEGLDLFFSEIEAAFPKRRNLSDKLTKIAIITGPYGSGHLSSANALEEALLKNSNYSIVKFDDCNDFLDPLYLVTEKYRSCKLYYDVAIYENNPRKFALLSILNSKLDEYFPKDRYHALYERLRLEDPDLIISTVHHRTEVTGVANLLDVPLRIVITDFEFPFVQWFYLNFQNPMRVKYWIPTKNRNFFRPMIRDYALNNNNTLEKPSRISLIFNQFFKDRPTSLPFLNHALDSLKIFEYLPFLTSSKIVPPKDENDILFNRKSLILSTDLDRKVISIGGNMMQSASVVGLIEKILRISGQLTHKIQIAVITNGNKEILRAATELFYNFDVPVMNELNSSDSANQVTARVFDKLSYPDEMAHLYKATHILIAKTGGASTAELMYSQTYFVRGFPLWPWGPWEIENAKHLENIGLSRPISNLNTDQKLNPLLEDLTPYVSELSDEDLLQQINTLLALPKKLQTENDPDRIYSTLYALLRSALER